MCTCSPVGQAFDLYIHPTFVKAFDGDLLVGFCAWLLCGEGCLDTEPFWRFLAGETGVEDDTGDAGGDGAATSVPRMAMSSVAVRWRLRRLSYVS